MAKAPQITNRPAKANHQAASSCTYAVAWQFPLPVLPPQYLHLLSSLKAATIFGPGLSSLLSNNALSILSSILACIDRSTSTLVSHQTAAKVPSTASSQDLFGLEVRTPLPSPLPSSQPSPSANTPPLSAATLHTHNELSARYNGNQHGSLKDIPLLESPSGWIQWERAIKDHLKMNGFADLLGRRKDCPKSDRAQGAEPFSSSAEKALQLKIDLWEDKQERANGMVINRCGATARAVIEPKEGQVPNLFEDLGKLRLRFLPKGGAVYAQLEDKFLSLMLDDCEDVSDFAAKLRRARDDLADLHKTCAIQNPLFISKFLRDLGPRFDTFRTTFLLLHKTYPEMGTDGIEIQPVSFEVAVMEAEKEEQAQRNADRQRHHPTALVARSRPPPGTQRHCTWCNKPNHLKEDCWALHPQLKEAYDKKRREQGHSGQGRGSQFRVRDQASRSSSTAQPHQDVKNKPIAHLSWQRPSDGNIIALHTNAPRTADTMSDSERLVRESWALDTGCNQHVTSSRYLFVNGTLKPYNSSGIRGYGHHKSRPTLVGTVRLPCEDTSGTLLRLELTNTLYDPNAGCNLLSYSQLRHSPHAKMEICDEGFAIVTSKGTIICDEKVGLYWPRLQWVESPNPVALAAYGISEAWLAPWHDRLGHLGEENLHKLVQMVHGMKPLPQSQTCEPCVQGKLKERPHNKPFWRGEYPLEFLHLDIIGPINPPGVHGERYLTTITCDLTALTAAEPHVYKSDLPRVFKFHLDKHERPERRCRRLRLDQAGENTSAEMSDLCRDRGILLETTATNQHQQNSVAEVTNRILAERTFISLRASGLPFKYWPYVAQAQAYIRMLTPHNRLNVTPYEAWYGDKPDISHLRTLGCRALALKTKKRKFQADKGVECRLLGYKSSRIYIFLRHDGQIIQSSNAVFFEPKPLSTNSGTSTNVSTPGTIPSPASQQAGSASGETQLPKRRRIEGDGIIALPDPPPWPQSEPTLTEPDPLEQPTEPSPFHRRPDQPAASQDQHDSLALQDRLDTPASNPRLSTPLSTPGRASQAGPSTSSSETAESQPDHIVKQSTLQNHPELWVSSRATKGHYSSNSVQRYQFPVMCFHMNVCLLSAGTEAVDPRSVREAKDGPYWDTWLVAMKDEFDSLCQNETWTLVPRPADRATLRGKWVYKTKTGPDGEILRHKARWVVRGFEQKEGIDYNETFASVVKPMTYKALFAIAAALDLELHQMDVKTAFLYGLVEETIYVEQPDEFSDGTGSVCQLKRALYGLKQAPRVWYLTLSTFLLALGFKPLSADLGIFCKDNTYIAIYVDDLLIAGPSIAGINDVKAALSRRFQMSDLGECSWYLGMKITRDRPQRSITLSQTGYIDRILSDFGMRDCKPAATPMDANTKLVPPEETYRAEEKLRQSYARAIGTLMYLMLGTRPDIAFAVSCLARYMSNPTPAHEKALKRVFRYLRGSSTFVLAYKGELQPLVGYTDADWGGDPQTRRSTSGYLFNIGSAAISWSSKRQPCVALSSCKAEYMGETQATKEAVWLRELMKGLTAQKEPAATVIFADNQGAIALAKNPQFHARTKHIDIQHHYVREAVEEGKVELQFTPTERQVADGLTKPLPRPAFEKFHKALGLRLP